MSTRCQIVVMEDETTMYPVKIYRHSDGYPSGVLPWLEPFAKAFHADRGSDPEYMVAQIIRSQAIADLLEYQKRLVENPDTARYCNPQGEYTGWGACPYWHGDIEYYYKVFPGGRVECWKVGSGEVPDDPDKWPSGKLLGQHEEEV